MNKERRLQAYRKGHRAELFAAFALMLKGYRIVSKRFKTPVGEVDLIGRKGDLVIFVEVKARQTEQASLDSISISAQNRISNAGNWWLSQQKDAANLSWRFDVIAVQPWRWPVHFENVW